MLPPVSLPTAPLTIPRQKFTNEIHIYNLLYYGGVDVVPLVGIYSSEAHPFSLVYEYMINLDLRQYLMNVPNVRGLELVLILMRVFSTHSLMSPDNS